MKQDAILYIGFQILNTKADLNMLYNPIQTNGFRKVEIRKTKTDPIDAAIIADMLRYSEPPIAKDCWKNINGDTEKVFRTFKISRRKI